MLVALCICIFLFPLAIHAQSPNNKTDESAAAAAHPAYSTRHHRMISHRRRVQRHVEPAQSIAPTPPPPQPVPPAQQPAVPATITFGAGRLQIDAHNSSLSQILSQVSRETGLAVSGLTGDERIYGQYGPGTVSSTVTSLLNGAGYNYVIVGNEENGKMKLLLTRRTGGTTFVASAPVQPNNGFMNSAPAQTPTMANPSEPPHPKTPQEIFEELRRMHPTPPQ